jgi:hypothetical protein
MADRYHVDARNTLADGGYWDGVRALDACGYSMPLDIANTILNGLASGTFYGHLTEVMEDFTITALRVRREAVFGSAQDVRVGLADPPYVRPGRRPVLRDPVWLAQSANMFGDASWGSSAGIKTLLLDTPIDVMRGQLVIPAIAGKNGSYTLASGDASTDIIVASSAHNLSSGDQIQFSALTGGTGLSTGTDYYIRGANLTATNFMVATAVGGAAVNFTSNITAGTLTTVMHQLSGIKPSEALLSSRATRMAGLARQWTWSGWTGGLPFPTGTPGHTSLNWPWIELVGTPRGLSG